MLDNLFVLLRCFLHALHRGRATRAPKEPKNICIIQTAQLGDMVCTTPMFRAVKEKYPHAKLTVVGAAINKEVLAGNPDVNEYLVWESDVAKMTGLLRDRKFDFACTTSPNFPGVAALYLAGVPCIAAAQFVGGLSPLETTSLRLARWLVLAMPHRYLAYAPREYLRLLEPIGIHADDTSKYVYFTKEAEHSAMQKLRESVIEERPFAIVMPGAGNKVKRWPPERFAAVADYIAQKYMPVAVVGSTGDRDEVSQMLAAAASADVASFSEQLSIEELKALVSKSSLFVSGDTGPLYFAEAFGVPTIDIVGPAGETVQPPISPRNIVLVPQREHPAIYTMNTRVYDADEAKRQAEATTIEEVRAAIDTLL